MHLRVNVSSDGSEVEELEQEEFHADALMCGQLGGFCSLDNDVSGLFRSDTTKS